MLHAVFLLLFMKLLAPLMLWIPLSVLAATLLIVAWNMVELDHVINLLKTSKSDSFVFFITFILTVVSDVTIAVAVGALVAMLLFTGRMIVLTEKQYKSRASSELDQDRAFTDLQIPKDVRIVYLSGPFFFGVASAANELLSSLGTKPKAIILDLSDVPFIDSSGFQALKTFIKSSYKSHIPVVVAGVTDEKIRRLVRYMYSTILTESTQVLFATQKEALEYIEHQKLPLDPAL